MKILGALLLPALLSTLTACLSGPEIRVSTVSLLTTKTAVSDDAGNAVSAIGYLKLTLVADVDLASLASDRDAELWYAVETCETHTTVNAWPYLLASGGNSYTALIAYKDAKGGSYNLASRPEDVCMTIGAGSMNPTVNTRSKVQRFVLSSSLKEELRAYDSDRGTVEFQLSPQRQSHMCRPTYRAKRTQ